uniref:Uncharacterized protein n=1 Tax=Candidatus Kentrum sp. LPFa TaxID=2126335 RepID=A0A450WD42_9GAMM|nr:MAG: hypothetical protein BECKLPF1236B_GA0070989_10719 [Candidatus Kentron sp. LPFa]
MRFGTPVHHFMRVVVNVGWISSAHPPSQGGRDVRTTQKRPMKTTEPLKPLPPKWGEIIVATVNKTVADSIRRGEGDPYRHRFLLTLIPPVFDPRKKGLWLASHPKSDGSKRFRTTTDPEEAYLFNGIKGEKALRKLKDEFPGRYPKARMDSANCYEWLKEEARMNHLIPDSQRTTPEHKDREYTGGRVSAQ